MSTEQSRVALLIDGDNISEQHADELFNKAAAYGDVIVRKCYGTLPNFPWKKGMIHRYAMETVAQFTHVPGKNITDIALVIDAMDLVHRGVVNVVCLASIDSDFSLLAQKLRESGIKIYGFGDNRAVQSFIQSCDEFFELSHKKDSSKISADSADAAESANTATPVRKQSFVEMLGAACDEYGDNDGWAFLAPVGNYLKRQDPACTPKNNGYKNLLDWVKSTGQFDIQREEENSPPKIRKKEK